MLKTIMLVAGEVSGDLLGAGLMAALKSENSETKFKFIGLGGENMQAEGLEPAFDMEELNVMGIAEVLPKLRGLFKRRDQLIVLAEKENIDILITIDAPDFNLRLAKKAKAKLKIPCVHYVSPSVWAWRKKRVFKMAKYLDHVLALFPFEPEFYKLAGLKCTFVGHPVAERLAEFTPENCDDECGFDADLAKIALLPGSRKGVIGRMMPEFIGAFDIIKATFPNLTAVIPIVNSKHNELLEPFIKDRDDIEIVNNAERFVALKQCRFAFAASGTSNLELAMLGIPMVIGYKMGKVTYSIAKYLVKIPYASPVNWVSGRKIIPEFIQNEMTVDTLSITGVHLLEDTKSRGKQLSEMKRVRWLLAGGEMGTGKGSSNKRAAKVVAEYL